MESIPRKLPMNLTTIWSFHQVNPFHSFLKKKNIKFTFSDDPRLCYSIREQICVGVWPNPKGLESRGFATTFFVKSRCIDASLVIDGSIAYPFNDGTRALLEIHPSDALLTVNLKE